MPHDAFGRLLKGVLGKMPAPDRRFLGVTHGVGHPDKVLTTTDEHFPKASITAVCGSLL